MTWRRARPLDLPLRVLVVGIDGADLAVAAIQLADAYGRRASRGRSGAPDVAVVECTGHPLFGEVHRIVPRCERDGDRAEVQSVRVDVACATAFAERAETHRRSAQWPVNAPLLGGVGDMMDPFWVPTVDPRLVATGCLAAAERAPAMVVTGLDVVHAGAQALIDAGNHRGSGQGFAEARAAMAALGGVISRVLCPVVATATADPVLAEGPDGVRAALDVRIGRGTRQWFDLIIECSEPDGRAVVTRDVVGVVGVGQPVHLDDAAALGELLGEVTVGCTSDLGPEACEAQIGRALRWHGVDTGEWTIDDLEAYARSSDGAPVRTRGDAVALARYARGAAGAKTIGRWRDRGGARPAGVEPEVVPDFAEAAETQRDKGVSDG